MKKSPPFSAITVVNSHLLKFKFIRNSLLLVIFSFSLLSFLNKQSDAIVFNGLNTTSNCTGSMSYNESTEVKYMHEANLDYTQLNMLDFNGLIPSTEEQLVEMCEKQNGNFVTTTVNLSSEGVHPKWVNFAATRIDMNGIKILDASGNTLSEYIADTVNQQELLENIQMLDDLCSQQYTNLLNTITTGDIKILRDSGHIVNEYEGTIEILLTTDMRILVSSTTKEIWETISLTDYDIASWTRYELHPSGRLLMAASREINRVPLRTGHCIERHEIKTFDNYTFEGDCNSSSGSNSGGINKMANTQNAVTKKFEQTSVSIYPSPGNGSQQLQLGGFDFDRLISLEVYDAFGKLIISKQEQFSTENNLNMTNLIPGMYFIKVWQEDQFASTQFIKN